MRVIPTGLTPSDVKRDKTISRDSNNTTIHVSDVESILSTFHNNDVYRETYISPESATSRLKALNGSAAAMEFTKGIKKVGKVSF